MKRFDKLLGMLATFLCVAGAAFGFSAPGLAKVEMGAPLPVLKYVGVIPLQWDEVVRDQLDQEKVEALEQQFPAVVREARRFQVLNDEIVADLWNRPAGREELISQYELHAFMSLVVQSRNDNVAFNLRMLGPQLENYLVESEVVPLQWLQTAAAERVKEKLEGLTFRLINRIPVDVSVTSVQGAYITLSGGEEQGVRVGDELTFYRVTLSALHPANQSWVGFQNKRLGRAKIMEVKKNAAVAEMTEQSYEGAIKIGDGAKIPAIATRKKFVRSEQNDELKGTENSIIIQPKRIGQDPARPETAAPAAATPSPAQPAPHAAPVASPQPAQPEAAPVGSPDTPTEMKETPVVAEKPQEAPPAEAASEQAAETAPAEEEKEPPLAGTLIEALGQKFSAVEIAAGPRLWSASSAASAASSIPPWLVSHVEARFSQAITSDIKVRYTGSFGFGPTSKGSFFGFGVRGEPYYQMAAKDAIPGVDYLNIGIRMQYESMGVDGQTFGGGDLISFGGFAGMQGKTDAIGKPLEWDGQFTVVPQATGKMGTKGGKRDVKGTFGYQLSGNAILVEKPKTWEWGGTASYATTDYTLSKGRIYFSDIFLGAVGRYRF